MALLHIPDLVLQPTTVDILKPEAIVEKECMVVLPELLDMEYMELLHKEEL